MKFIATIDKVLPEQGGVSKSGNAWRKQSVIAVYDTTKKDYPKSILIDIMGDRIAQVNLQPGGRYELDVDFVTREWNGRYFMSATCWNAVPFDAVNVTPATPINDPYTTAAMPTAQPKAQPEPQGDSSDLPF